MSKLMSKLPPAAGPALALLALAACGRPAPPSLEAVPSLSASASEAAPPAVRLAIQLIAARSPGLAPAAPLVVEPHHDLYEGQAPSADASPPSDQPGFRLTVPVCRRAERLNDPLARTAECDRMLKAARDQGEACRKAFETGDDKAVLSPACRQAAGFR